MGDMTTRPASSPPAKKPRAKAQPHARPATPPTPKEKPEIKCFQHKGVYGSPRLILFNRPFFGIGLKFGAAAQYRSVWEKGKERMWGISGEFELGISGINFLGSRRRKHALILLGIHGGIGIANLVREQDGSQEQTFTEYTPRIGMDLHFVKFFSLSLFLKGGYILSMMKNKDGGTFEKQHGGYVTLGAEFDVSFLSRAFSPFITVTYSSYKGGRHELTAGGGLRY